MYVLLYSYMKNVFKHFEEKLHCVKDHKIENQIYIYLKDSKP